MAGAYRYWLICLPDVDPNGLVLLTENDVDGGMIRDYSVPGRPRELRRVLLADVPGVFRAATLRIPVEPHRYADEWHWRNEIRKRSGKNRNAPARQSLSSMGPTLPCSKGSKYQIQRWVNDRPRGLSEAIWGAFPRIADVPLSWVSPLASDSFREYQDDEFLQAVGQDRLSKDLAEFWPKGGPVWDALAVLAPPRVGIILVEAKAYPEEAEQRHCKAEGPSRSKISGRLDELKTRLGANTNADWLGTRYQVANRLAYLWFLRSHGVPAWYVQICFCDDSTHRPTSEAQWQEALPRLWQDLGLSKTPEFVADVLLPAL